MNDRQEKIRELYNSAEDKGTINYYGSFQFVLNVENRINELEFDSDKITLAQMANDFELASKLIETSIKNKQEKDLYLKLKETNVDIDETINIELLSDRYSFLGDLLDSIITDIEVQQRLISLSNEKLELFKQLFDKVKNEVSNTIPIITKVLSRLGTSPYIYQYNDSNNYVYLNSALEEKLEQGIPLSESDKEKLLFIYTSNTNWTVQSLEDLSSFGEKGSKDILEIDEMVNNERNSPVKNITNIQNALLWKSYGISLNEAKSIVSKYKAGNIEVTDKNKDTIQLYMSLYKIVTEKDAGKLIKIFDEYSEQKEISFNYIQPVLIESELRDMFLHELNKVALKTDRIPSQLIDGIPIYSAGTDFKVIMTSVGAYQGNLKVDNYSEYWNSPHIRSHGNCCSLVANNNLSTATINNICFGFSEFEPGMLLRAGNKDLNSTIYSKDLDVSMRSGNFMLPNDLINSTRGKYNELVYERRDLSDNKSNYKKNPDYLVFFEEFENENIETLTLEDIEKEPDEEKRKILQEQKRMWDETKKASIDFSRTNENDETVPLPIVKINREECAKNEIKKIQEAFESYIETKDSSLLPSIITQFENNRVGNKLPHNYIRDTYFSENSIQTMLNQIIDVIKTIEDEQTRRNSINMMGKLISQEIKNFKDCQGTNPGFNHKQYIQIFKEMRRAEMNGQNR